MSQADLGAAVEPPVHWQTIQRIESGKTPLTTHWMERLAKPLGVVDPLELLIKPTVRMVGVIGAVQAGSWAETWEFPQEGRELVPVPDDRKYRSTTLAAVETRGNSMDRRYPPGTLLVFADYRERPERLKEGRRYIVERERADGRREATVKKLWKDDSGKFWLLPESNDPKHQAPIPIDGTAGETVRILGRVVYAVHREE